MTYRIRQSARQRRCASARGSILSQVTRVVVYHNVDLWRCFQQVSQEEISLAQAFRIDEFCQVHHKAIRVGSKKPSSRAIGTAPCRLQLLVCNAGNGCQIFPRRKRRASLSSGNTPSEAPTLLILGVLCETPVHQAHLVWLGGVDQEPAGHALALAGSGT